MLVAGFAAGLLIRASLLDAPGVFDLDIYESWTRAAVAGGLVDAYRLPLTNAGSYFPTEVALLTLCRRLSTASGIGFHEVVKVANLVFDVGTFALLLVLLRRLGASPCFALLQWLHPWFLVIFSLGYVDGHFAFFMLWTLLLLRRATRLRDHLIAGLPLAVAFTMKPQAQVPLLGIVAFAAFEALRTRRADALGLLLFPVLAFAGWSAFLAAALDARTGAFEPLFLAKRYLATSEILPCLNGTRLNAWYPVALALKPPGQPVWAVSDRIAVWGPLEVKHLAGVAVLSLVAGFAWVASRRRERVGEREQVLCVAAFAALVVPNVMTQAHENHFLLGSLLMIPLLATSKRPGFHVAVQTILLLDAVNAFALYERGAWAQAVRAGYTSDVRVALSLLSTAAFAVAAGALLRRVAALRG